MRFGTGKALWALVVVAAAAVLAPAGAAAASEGVSTSVWTVHGSGASAAVSLNVLTLNDQRRIDNRISAKIAPTGRLVLTAPEGLGDPDGSGSNCDLDNAKPGESSAQEVSCAPGYIGAIVGDLNVGNDVFDADPALTVYVGALIDGQRRSLGGGPGHDRLVGGAAADLLDGGVGPDSIVGGGDRDFLIGGPGADNLSGGGGGDVLLGLAGADKLNGGAAKDVCKGGEAVDTGKSCETTRGIP
jgi:Ca2+-binding RTX toxin-like protein